MGVCTIDEHGNLVAALSALTAEVATLKAEVERLRGIREALLETLTALPDSVRYEDYAWNELSGEDQDYVKAIHDRANRALEGK